MSIAVGNIQIQSVKFGTQDISKVYVGDELIFQSSEPTSIVLTIDDSGGAIEHFLVIRFTNNSMSVTVNWGDSTSTTLNAPNDGDYYEFDRTFQCPGEISISWSGIGALVELAVTFNNIIGSYDFTAFNSLLLLHIENNFITDIIVAGMGNIIDLYPHDNLLTSIDVSGLVSMQNLDCFINNLGTLDISECVGLITIDASSDNLSSITVGNNLSLLEFFRVNNNNLTSVDISNFPSLVSLWIYVNPITSIDVSNSPHLNSVFIDRCNIGVTDVSNLLIQLDNNGLSNGICHTENQTPAAIPNAGGQTAKTNLEGKGWVVVVDE